MDKKKVWKKIYNNTNHKYTNILSPKLKAKELWENNVQNIMKIFKNLINYVKIINNCSLISIILDFIENF